MHWTNKIIPGLIAAVCIGLAFWWLDRGPVTRSRYLTAVLTAIAAAVVVVMAVQFIVPLHDGTSMTAFHLILLAGVALSAGQYHRASRRRPKSQ